MTKNYNKNGLYIKSPLSENYFFVKKENDMINSAKILDILKQKMISFVHLLYTDLKNGNKLLIQYEKNILKLKDRCDQTEFSENVNNDKITSYNINKGEKIVLCLRSKIDNKIQDINLLTYVLIHEITHSATKTYGHDQNFLQLFDLLLIKAEEYGFYKKIIIKMAYT